MNPDGTGLVNLTNNPANDGNPVWSPDSQKIAFERPAGQEIFVMNRDGSGAIPVTGAANRSLIAWQPILKGYPRPKAAGPLYLPLVPAYQPCTSAQPRSTPRRCPSPAATRRPRPRPS